MFSPILPASALTVSATDAPCSVNALSFSALSVLFSAANSTNSPRSFWNSAFLAEKSVLAVISTTVMVRPPFSTL